MAMKTRAQPQRKRPTVDLGIGGLRVLVHSHISSLWESERDFAAAVGLVEAGLQGSQYCGNPGKRKATTVVASLPL